VTIKIGDEHMSSERSGHTAELWPMPGAGESPTMWRVSWLPGAPLDRNHATTAMVLADVAAPEGIDSTHSNWPAVTSWAAELGLSADEAVRAIQAQPDREAGR
jgi:hypothetical protein